MEITVMLLLVLIIGGLGAFNLKAKSNIFGVVLGITLIVFGLFLLADDIEFKTGFTAQPQGTFGVNESLNVTYTYEKLSDRANGLHETITVGMMMVGLYIMFRSGFNIIRRQREN